MRVRRAIASIPVRTAGETWRAVIELITRVDSVDRDQLEAAASVMETLIADEQPAAVPIIVKGNGPRLLVYCLYQEDAMETGTDIDALSWNPTEGDWRITAPAENEDIEWMNRTLTSRAPRITVHAADQAAPEDDSKNAAADEASFEINWEVLDKP